MAETVDADIEAGLSAAGVGLAFLDADGVVRWANRAFAELAGRDVLGMPLASLLDGPVPDLAGAPPGQPQEIDTAFAARPAPREIILDVTTHAKGATCIARDAEPLRAGPRRAAMLQAVTTQLARAESTAQVADVVTGVLHDRLQASCGVFYVAENADVFRLDAARGVPAEMLVERARLRRDDAVPLARAIMSGASVWYEERAEMLAEYPHLAASAVPASMVQATCALPLRDGPHVLGGMAFSFSRPRRFTRADRDALEGMATQCAQALARALAHETEQSARLEAQRKAFILENVSDAVILLDLAGHVVYWSRGAQAIFGYEPAEIVGRSIAVLHPHGDEDVVRRDVARVPGGLDTFGEWEVRRRDGSAVWVDLRTSVARGADGEPAGVVGVASVVTERRRAEQERLTLLADLERRAAQLRGLAEAALVVNTPAPLEQMLAAVTRKARELIGAHRARTCVTRVGEPPVTAVSASEGHGRDDVPDDVARLVRERNRPVRVVGHLAAPLLSRDGHNIGLIDLSDKYEGAFTVADEDVLVQLAHMTAVASGNILLLRAVQSEKDRAEQASRAKDQFLAMLGHELRNPLSPIVTALQVMRLSDTDAFAKERAILERQVQHLVRLVDDLLDVSRITRGRVELDRRRLELSSVVAQALEMTGGLFERRGQRLRVDVGRRGLAVEGDAHRLTQVVTNLLTNAAKYTDDGGEVDVVARREDGGVVLRVRDTGIGMAPELLARVFDLFAQGEQAIDRSLGGLGLGLAIVRSMVELHGGSVSAHSDGPGRGSEFVVRLPVAAPEDLTPVPLPSATGPVSGPWVGRRILVVDDNQDAVELLARLLRSLGLYPEVAYDGPQALRLAEASKPDAAVLDIGLPVMDGFELARRLLEGQPDLRIAALTGYGQDADRERTRAAGFRDHLVKPVDVDDLRAMLRRMFTP